jgi:hypothetical protein
MNPAQVMLRPMTHITIGAILRAACLGRPYPSDQPRSLHRWPLHTSAFVPFESVCGHNSTYHLLKITSA